MCCRAIPSISSNLKSYKTNGEEIHSVGVTRKTTTTENKVKLLMTSENKDDQKLKSLSIYQYKALARFRVKGTLLSYRPVVKQ